MSEMMTAEQAASKLTNIMHDDHYAWHPSILEAFRMAIEALKHSEIPNSSDTISRQAAIDALHMHLMYRMGTDSNKKRLDEWINNLPSAQPEQRWNPCSERLPDMARRVLLSGHGQVMVGVLHSFGKYSLEPTGISHVYPKDDIEAWMPLPEPYRKEGEADE